MVLSAVVEGIRRKFELIRPVMNERVRRQWAASETLSLGRGGVTAVAEATGLSRTTIAAGVRELEGDAQPPPAADGADPGRVRAPGGGRHPVTAADPALVEDLEDLVSPATRGDPQSPLRWTSKSTRRLAEELGRRGRRVSHVTVASLLDDLGYSL